MIVRLGRMNPEETAEGFAGFRTVGARGQYNDYRDDAIYGIGLNCGIAGDGRCSLASSKPQLRALTRNFAMSS